MKEILNAKLIIIGEGPEQKNLKSQISNLKLNEKVFMLGKLSREELLRYLKASDIFVLNTGYEGFSHQVLEAMAVEIPVISTKVGGNVEIIEHRQNGLLVEYNNKQELKNSIMKLLDNKELSQKLVNSAKETIKNFSKEKMIAETIKVFNTLKVKS